MSAIDTQLDIAATAKTQDSGAGREESFAAKLIAVVLALDSGGMARLRRGANEVELLLMPQLGGFLGSLPDRPRRLAMTTARIAAILGRNPTGAPHPATALAEAGYHERRLGRLLASDPETLPQRLEVAARFLAANRQFCQVEPFHWLLHEFEGGHRTRQRAEWAARFTEMAERLKRSRQAP
jgi:hypothetical protein